MKVENHVFVNQMEEKRKLGSGKKVKGFLPNLPGGIKLKNGNLQKDTVSFGSPVIDKRVIWRNTNERIISSLANFIDKFEDATQEMRNKLGRRLIKDTAAEKDWAERHNVSGPKTEYYKNVVAYTYTNEKLFGLITEKHDVYEPYSAKYLGGGISGNAYYVKRDNFDTYVIKEAKRKKCTDPINGPGGLIDEYNTLAHSEDYYYQKGISLMETKNGNFFLISKFADGESLGQHGKNFKSISRNGLKDLLRKVDEVDWKGIFNPDWNINNILFDNEEHATIIDLQWFKKSYLASQYFTFCSYKEEETNFLPLEGGAIASYIHHLYDHTKSKDQARNFLNMYLQERANYCFDRHGEFEKIREAVYKKPSEDVLDAEILRLSILKNHNHQFLYVDKRCEEPRDMLKMIRYQTRANFAAKMLSEFQPQEPTNQISDDKKKYFEEMRDFGKYWHQKTQEWYKGSIKWMEKLVLSNGRCQNNNTGYFYFPEKFGKGDKKEQNAGDSAVSDKTMLSDVLSNGASRQYTRSFKKIRSKITELEANFMDLKQAVDKNDNVSKNDAKEDIEDLISEVLV